MPGTTRFPPRRPAGRLVCCCGLTTTCPTPPLWLTFTLPTLPPLCRNPSPLYLTGGFIPGRPCPAFWTFIVPSCVPACPALWLPNLVPSLPVLHAAAYLAVPVDGLVGQPDLLPYCPFVTHGGTLQVTAATCLLDLQRPTTVVVVLRWQTLPHLLKKTFTFNLLGWMRTTLPYLPYRWLPSPVFLNLPSLPLSLITFPIPHTPGHLTLPNTSTWRGWTSEWTFIWLL